MKKILFTVVVAFILWFVMFSPLTAPYVNFWWTMTASALILVTLATLFGGRWWRDFKFTGADVLAGLFIAVALWGVFWAGDKISQMIFNFARPQVDLIYGMKEGESPWLLTVLMLFIIGPAEEIFWRGYVQKRLSGRWNAIAGFVATTAIYALVHASSCNFMLTMTALDAGAVWGFIYYLYPQRLGVLIVSHALWDVAVFVWFPI